MPLKNCTKSDSGLTTGPVMLRKSNGTVAVILDSRESGRFS